MRWPISATGRPCWPTAPPSPPTPCWSAPARRSRSVTNRGFADVIEIARQDRPSLYDPFADRPAPLVERDHRVEVGGRLGPDGSELEPVDVDGLLPLPVDVEAVAVCLLHSDLNRSARGQGRGRRASGRSRRRGLGRRVARVPRVRADADDGRQRVPAPVVSRLLGAARRAGRHRARAHVGGWPRADLRRRRPARRAALVRSGGRCAGRSRVRGRQRLRGRHHVRHGWHVDGCVSCPWRRPRTVAGADRSPGFPIRFPSLDVHTIGAGGGSIARIDPGGALAVGPAQRRRRPGPACYGRGGVEPTVYRRRSGAGPNPCRPSVPGPRWLGRRRRPRCAVAGGGDAGRRGRGRERRDGTGGAGGHRRPRGRSAQLRARRVRWGRAVARVRARRVARHRDRRSCRPGRRAVRCRFAGCAAATRARSLVAGRVIDRRCRRRAVSSSPPTRPRLVGADATVARRSSTSATRDRATS